MSSLDLELDGRMDDLELEWREARVYSKIERRWFALLSAIRSLHTECSVLLEASKLADVA